MIFTFAVPLAVFQVFSSHMCLVSTVLDSRSRTAFITESSTGRCWPWMAGNGTRFLGLFFNLCNMYMKMKPFSFSFSMSPIPPTHTTPLDTYCLVTSLIM